MPGTTGETLSILTNALGGMDHKLHIILNKGRYETHYYSGWVGGCVCGVTDLRCN
jgi:hypothetical protein